MDPRAAERMPIHAARLALTRSVTQISRVAPSIGARAPRPPCGTRGVRARLRAAGQPPRAGLVLEEVGATPILRYLLTYYYGRQSATRLIESRIVLEVQSARGIRSAYGSTGT